MKATLYETIIKSALIFPMSCYERWNIELKEPNRTTITIKNVPDDCIAIKIDEFPTPSQFIIGDNMCKRADYALVSKNDDVVIYIELKDSENTGNTYIINQLKGAQCVFYYISKLCLIFLNKNYFCNLKERFVSFRSANIRKRTTGKQSSLLNDSPENMMKIKHGNTAEWKQIAHLNR